MKVNQPAKLAVLFLMPQLLLAQQPIPMTTEQRTVIDRRAAIMQLDEMFGDPALIREGINRKEAVDEAVMEALQPPTSKSVKKVYVSRTDREMYNIHVYPNQVTTLTITDSMGEPWPLEAAPIVPSNAYQISYTPNAPGFATIETSAKFVPTSAVLKLKDRLIPIQLQLISDNRHLHYSVHITVEGKSPLNAIKPSRPYGGLDVGGHDDFDLARFIAEPPEEAQRLQVFGSKEIAAWSWNGMTVFRSPYALINPTKIIQEYTPPDFEETLYLVEQQDAIATFLNQVTGDVINVEVLERI